MASLSIMNRFVIILKNATENAQTENTRRVDLNYLVIYMGSKNVIGNA